LSNVGPGLNMVGPIQNFGWISDPGKWLLIFLMLAGRLELYAMLVLFLPVTWRK
jgi:trk system potassium uptake protein